MCQDEITIRTVTWSEAEPEIRTLREAVFIEEQNVPEDLEWDGLDAECTHVLAQNKDGEPIGTGRITKEGHIGRMAVLMPWRGHGVGDLLLTSLITLAREHRLSRVTLWAQTHVIPFYERHGFASVGDEFPDAGIPHKEMVLEL